MVASWAKAGWSMIRDFCRKLNSPVVGAKLLPAVGNDFQFEVRNVRGGTAFARVFLEDVTDDNDRSTGVVTSPVEVYRYDSLELARLFGTARGVYGILSVDRRHQVGPALRVNTILTDRNGVRSRGEMFVSGPAPLEGQQEIRLTIRVVFYSDDGGRTELTDADSKYFARPLLIPGDYEVGPLKPQRTRHA